MTTILTIELDEEKAAVIALGLYLVLLNVVVADGIQGIPVDDVKSNLDLIMDNIDPPTAGRVAAEISNQIVINWRAKSNDRVN